MGKEGEWAAWKDKWWERRESGHCGEVDSGQSGETSFAKGVEKEVWILVAFFISHISVLTLFDRQDKTNAVTHVSCGEKHTAVINDDKIYTFGCNDAGQLGIGSLSSTAVPTLPQSLSTTPIISVSCGVNHTVCVSRLGEAYSWGWGENGRLGLGDEEKRINPTVIDKLKDDLLFATRAICGASHTAVITDNGDLVTFGWNLYGQCGIQVPSSVLLPVVAMSGKIVTQASCGFAHTGAVTARGELWMFGFGEEGQLGDGMEESRFSPEITEVDVNNEGVRALSVCCGHTHTMVCVSNESLLKNEERRRRVEREKKSARIINRWFRSKLLAILLHKRYEKVVVVKAVPKKVEILDDDPVVDEEELQRERERVAEKERIEQEKLRLEREEREKENRLQMGKIAEEQERLRIQEMEKEMEIKRKAQEEESLILEQEEKERQRLVEEAESLRREQEERVRIEKERVRLELEKMKMLEENKLMAKEDNNSRIQREIRREKIAKYKLRMEQKKLQEKERQERLEKQRAEAIKKAQDRFKKTVKEKKEVKIVKKSSSKTDFSKVNSMADRLRDITEMKREKEEKERIEKKKEEDRIKLNKEKKEKERELMIRKREKRLMVEAEEKERLRREEEEKRKWERVEFEESERQRTAEDEERRAGDEAVERRRRLKEKLMNSDKRAKATLEKIATDSSSSNFCGGAGGKNDGMGFNSAKQWGRKLSKGGGTNGVVNYRGSSR